MAYVGPGLGMGVIGTIFGVLAAIVLALFGLFWYPLKRRFSRKKAGADGLQSAPIVAENERTDHRGTTVPTRPENPAESHPDNRLTNHSGALSEAPDPATVNRTDNPVR